MKNQLLISYLVSEYDQGLCYGVHAVSNQPTEQRMRSIRVHMDVVVVAGHLGCQ
jgi:hypothetical protein